MASPRARAGARQRQTAALPRRTSSRVQNSKAKENSGSDARAGVDELGLEQAEDDDDGGEDAEEDDGEEESTADGSGPGGSGPGGALAVLADGAAAVEKKQEHKSGVWDVFSPTGFPLPKERTAKMDHKDGKPWEVEVWNMLEDPQPPNDEVNFQSVARFYEQKNRALMTVVHMGMFKDDELIGIEPHDRMFPTGFYQPKSEFKGTILSCVDLVYCDGPDLTTPYNEWRGSHHTTAASNTKRFISEICAGYYVKLNTNSKPMKDKAMWAVLYAFRPWASPFGEPQVAVMEMKEGKMVKGATVKHVNACDIVAVGGLTNSLCNAVCAWLTENMPCFKSIRTEEQLAKGATPRSEADVGRALEESLGILDLALCRKRFVANMRAYADELIANRRCLLGIREGNVKWTKVEEGKEDEEITTTINKETTKFDKWWIRQLLRACETICAVTEFGGKRTNFADKAATFAPDAALRAPHDGPRGGDPLAPHEARLRQRCHREGVPIPTDQPGHPQARRREHRDAGVRAGHVRGCAHCDEHGDHCRQQLGAIEGCDGLGPEADAAHVQEHEAVLQGREP